MFDFGNLDSYDLGSGSSTDGIVGPQTDGTYNIPDLAVMAQPLDAGGGSAAQYGGAVLDIFKYGVGLVAANQSQQNMLDYKRYEATNGGLYQQGSAAGVKVGKNGTTVGISNGMLLLVGAVVLILVMEKKA